MMTTKFISYLFAHGLPRPEAHTFPKFSLIISVLHDLWLPLSPTLIIPSGLIIFLDLWLSHICINGSLECISSDSRLLHLWLLSISRMRTSVTIFHVFNIPSSALLVERPDRSLNMHLMLISVKTWPRLFFSIGRLLSLTLMDLEHHPRMKTIFPSILCIHHSISLNYWRPDRSLNMHILLILVKMWPRLLFSIGRLLILLLVDLEHHPRMKTLHLSVLSLSSLNYDL